MYIERVLVNKHINQGLATRTTHVPRIVLWNILQLPALKIFEEKCIKKPNDQNLSNLLQPLRIKEHGNFMGTLQLHNLFKKPLRVVYNARN